MSRFCNICSKILDKILTINVYDVLMIYYVEDDPNVRELSLYALRQSGLDCSGYEDSKALYAACKYQLPDLFLLDIMLPGEDGLSILEHLRSDPRTSSTPVMMLSAKGTEYDKVKALDAGADDYLAKPFGMMELVSRCKALLRRSSNKVEEKKVISCGDVSVNIEAHEAFVSNKQVELSPKEFDLLATLIENQGRVLSRSQLLEDVWDITFVGETRTVDSHIQTLRRKLNRVQDLSGDIIQTVHGVGYRAKAN